MVELFLWTTVYNRLIHSDATLERTC